MLILSLGVQFPLNIKEGTATQVAHHFFKFLKIQGAISRTTAPILGLFVLI